MDQGTAGRYRTIRVRVGSHVAPPPEKVPGMMSALLDWWNVQATRISPILSSAIIHHRFETIHPFADGNGRTGRMLALWELYRRRFDSHHIFSIDEYYWEDRPRYYAAFLKVRKEKDDLTSWLEYSAEGLRRTLERVWTRIQKLSAHAHPDHIADLVRLKKESGAPVYISEREATFGAETISEGREFKVGALTAKALLTWGHSRGGMTFFVTGLARPVSVVGDSIFAGSMGGGNVSYKEAIKNNVEKILTLPDATIICPGHAGRRRRAFNQRFSIFGRGRNK